MSGAKGKSQTILINLEQGTDLDFFEIVCLVKSQPEPVKRGDGKIIFKCILILEGYHKREIVKQTPFYMAAVE